MSDTQRQIDSPPLSDEEMADIDEYYAHPEEHVQGTLEEFLKELHKARNSD